jgi:hypothetical protein
MVTTRVGPGRPVNRPATRARRTLPTRRLRRNNDAEVIAKETEIKSAHCVSPQSVRRFIRPVAMLN